MKNLKSKNEKIYVLALVQFDECFSYYDTSHKIINDNKNKDTEMGDEWNEAKNDKFSRVIIEKQIIRRGATINFSTIQLQKKFVVINIEEKRDNSRLTKSIIDNNYLLSNQFMPLFVPSKILSFLYNISRADTPLPLKIFHNPENKKDLQKSPNILQDDHITDQP